MASKSTLAIFLIAILLLSATFAKKEENKKEEVKKGSSRIDGPIIGIDLGTTYSCVAIYRNNKTEIIPDEFGNRITPSVVSFTEKGDRLIGEAAKNNAVYNPRNTFYDVKRLIGRRYSEILEKDAKLFSYDIVDKNDKPYIKVQREKDGEVELLAPEEISAMVLQKMKSIAEKYLGQPVKYAVITVPAYFNDQQRQATADAGKIAGLEVKRIVNEPTAASMAYGMYKSKEHNILVFDLGGGTFDVSLLRIDNGLFEVVATAGDTRLGGEDFDLRVVDHFVKEFKKEHGKNLKDSKYAFQRLKLAVERAKRELSSQMETSIEIDALMDGIDFSKRFSRALFEKINGDLFKKTLDPVKQVLSDAGLSKSDVDEIVLVGGSTRIPKVKELLSEFFGGKTLNQEVNPDEAVADGAAVQGGVLSGATESSGHDVILVDVTPLSLGVETQGGIMSVIIPRNTPIPCDKAETYTTTENYQAKLSIPIYEGERKQAKFNRLLGTLDLDNIPPAPRGVPKIKIQFQLNQDGILKVIATDEGTGNKREITIRKGTFSDKEIDRMKKDAEKNADEDAKIVEKVEARHKLERFIEQTSAQLQSEVASKLDAGAVAKLQKLLKEKSAWVRKNFESAEKSEFKKQLKDLKKQTGATFAKLYGDDPKLAVGDDDDDDDDDKPKNEDDIDAEVADEDRPISQRKPKDEL